MSGNVFFNTILSHSQLFIPIPIPAPRFITIPFPVPSVIPVPCHCQSHTSISSHQLLFFIDITKQITTKLTTNGSLFVSKTTENQTKIGSLSANCIHRLISLLWVKIGKRSIVIPLHSHQAIPMLFSIPTELQQYFPQNPQEFPT